MPLIDAIIADFNATKKKSVFKSFVDENGNPYEIHYTPMTVEEKFKARLLAEKNGNIDEAEYTAQILILKCTDKDGNRLFAAADSEALRRKANGGKLLLLVRKIEGAGIAADFLDEPSETDSSSTPSPSPNGLSCWTARSSKPSSSATLSARRGITRASRWRDPTNKPSTTPPIATSRGRPCI
ncbi:MAG: hypothetical protein ABW189_05610 [Rickettsiales bacterium]